MKTTLISVLLTLLLAPLVAAAEDEYPDQTTALLGVMLRPVPLDVLESVNLTPGTGTMVTRVFPGTAADQIGLRPGDVIINVNGTEIDSRRDVRRTVIEHNSGDDVSVSVLRPGSSDPVTLQGQFSEMPPWLEERIHRWVPRMTERWEDHVVARQKEMLAMREKALQEMEKEIAALEQEQQQSLLNSDGLLDEPLRFIKDPDYTPLPASTAPAWNFHYHWCFHLHKREHTCDTSSLAHF